jgi:hypothetical protein
MDGYELSSLLDDNGCFVFLDGKSCFLKYILYQYNKTM